MGRNKDFWKQFRFLKSEIEFYTNKKLKIENYLIELKIKLEELEKKK